jgi:hypothetical protein
MSQGRKERTPAQLAVLAQAREKAKIVIAERAKINAFQKTVSPEPVAVSEETPQEPEPLSVSKEDPQPVPPEPEHMSVLEDPASESEDEEPRLTRREVGEMIHRSMSQRPSPKYHYINGMYIKIK